MKRKFNIITIIGVGLIGGAVALSAKSRGIVRTVRGFFRTRATYEKARKRKVVDQGFFDLKDSVTNADLVILATPISSIISLGKKITDYINKDTIVSDVGSSKLEIVKALDSIYSKKGLNFIGSHPLAGSEKSGLEWANENFFQDRICIITPTPRTRSRCLIIKDFWRSLGCKVLSLSPQEHDRILSSFSHFPHLLIYALLNFLHPKYQGFSPPGLKDLTRIGASPHWIWDEIFMSNRRRIIKDIKDYQKILDKYRLALERGSYKSLTNMLKRASAFRSLLT